MNARWLLFGALAACGSSTKPAATNVEPAQPSASELAAQQERRETARRAVIVAEHRKLESASQDALGTSCGDLDKWAKQHCAPTCYPLEPKDARAGTKLTGPVVIQHRVCQAVLGRDELGPLQVMDELEHTKLRVRPHRKRFPKPHAKKSWQLEIATWLAEAQKLPRGDVAIVSGKWRTIVHPLTQQSLRCVTVSRFTRAVRGKLGDCGGIRGMTCEAGGSVAALGINLVHYRLAEAKRMQETGDAAACQQAALEAVAVGRGLPRWRQYAKLNVGEWTEGLVYKTRFDGLLDEDQLFEAAMAHGNEAQSVYAACGGAPNAPTTVEQEQSFHACP